MVKPIFNRRDLLGAAAGVAVSTVSLKAADAVAQKAGNDKAAIRPFRVNVPEAELAEMRRRIKATRFPEKETVSDFSQGVQLAFIQALARYWATDYDWHEPTPITTLRREPAVPEALHQLHPRAHP